MTDFDDNDIAIVGMALRVPGANSPEKFWENLRNGVESLEQFTDEELSERGVSPSTLADPGYVKAGMPLDRVDYFDPEFFGFSAKEAAILDPQHRQFYEVSWEALERASHDPGEFDGSIGVFAGCGMSAYFAYNILSNDQLVDSVGLFLLRHTGNDKDFLATRVSYAFDLKGPSVNVQTACSTSLVAVHLAVQSLLSGECDMALAGGSTIDLPHRIGYQYKEGEILSPDGHCRAFDHNAKGTIFGSGTGVVVLRRLADAVADGDHIHAVVKGTAVNNDGSGKVGYLAPSVEGQAAAVAEALAVADIDADSIGYVECHGTGTPVGDPIEIAALTRAFRETSAAVRYCRIGSVKTNIGHLDTAAGVSGLIKATLAVEHGLIPPTLNYEAPNPKIEFEGGPFAVASELLPWHAEKFPRRAGVNSLGVGGTNAFVVVEQPPELPGDSQVADAPAQPLIISARSKKAVDQAAEQLAKWLVDHPEASIADISYTLMKGRKAFDHRRIFSARTPSEAAQVLIENDARRVFNHSASDDEPSVVFMFPGGGAQYFRMGRGLYDAEPTFRATIDRGLELLAGRFETDLKAIFFADSSCQTTTDLELAKPSVQLPLTFLVEYALSELWSYYGLKPDALIGHSMGENTAACVAGVISFEDALGLVLLRGQLMDEVPSGGMLSVSLPADELRSYLGDELDLAAANSPTLSVASGDVCQLETLSARLTSQGIDSTRVKINIAAHSRLLNGITQRFRDYLQSIELNEPNLPIVSNRTGNWLTAKEARDPDYWVGHLRNTVLFADGIQTLLEREDRVFIEVGPGVTLGSLVRQNPDAPAQRVFGSLRHPEDTIADDVFLKTVVGRLWSVGAKLDESKFWPQQRRRMPLPTYPFQRASYWIEPGTRAETNLREVSRPMRIEDTANWYQSPVWVQQGFLQEAGQSEVWLVFTSGDELTKKAIAALQQDGHTVVVVTNGDTFARIDEHSFTLAPEAGGAGYQELVSALVELELVPDRILHGWLVTLDHSFRPGSSFFHRNLEYGFYSLFYLARALGKASINSDVHITVVTNGALCIDAEAVPYAEKATVLGPCRVIPREMLNISCSLVDIATPHSNSERRNHCSGDSSDELHAGIASLITELGAPAATETIAWRNGVRHKQQVTAFPGFSEAESQSRLKEQGVYLITGGLGGIGSELSRWLARNLKATLVLIGRTPLPQRSEWSSWLAESDDDDQISRAIRTVRELERLGATVRAFAADVTVIEEMQTAIAEVNAEFGKIDGVFHAAGVIRDNLIPIKSQRDIEEVFSAKLYGTLVLDELFSNVDLDFMVLFSSTSSWIAPQGQVDYVGANAFLNAYADSMRARDRYPVTAVNWGIWSDAGMVAPAKSSGIESGNIIAGATLEPTSHPLFSERHFWRDGVTEKHVVYGVLSSDSSWIMDEHRLRAGQALLPGTGYLELIRAALVEAGHDGHWKLSNLVFDNPLYIPDGAESRFRVELTGQEKKWDADICYETISADGGSSWLSCATASVTHDVDKDVIPEEELICIEEINARCTGRVSSAGATGFIRTAQEAHLNFGPRWNVLKRIAHGDGEAIAYLQLNEKYVGDLVDYGLHPGLLDIATGCAMNLIPGYADDEVAKNLWVPITYRGFEYLRPLESEIYSWVRISGDSSTETGYAAFDVLLTDTTGRPLVRVNQLRLRKLDGALQLSSASESRPEATQSETSASQSDAERLSPGEQALQHNLSQGIRAAEGIEALVHIVESHLPSQVIVSSMELAGLSAQLDAISASANAGDTATFDRPELDSEFEAPRNSTEKLLAEMWAKLLGVDGVGIHDSFFDLGGHSLVAVRLFNEIADQFGIDLPMSVLMQSPTIAGLGELIGSTDNESEENETSDTESLALEYQYIVPMHTGPVGGATPLFVVAGMFGNVLNLSHLAHLLGEERPFYAIQARGLYGDALPHEDLSEMAADYIAELRKVQPHGPYLLGGFSGGGITAYEMARQLLDAGEQVDQLILLDTPLPGESVLTAGDKVAMFWQKFRDGGLPFLKTRIRERIEWEREKARKKSAAEDGAENNGREFQSQRIGNAFIHATLNYDMQSVPVDITLFRPKLQVEYELSGGRRLNSERRYIFDDNGWSRYASEVTVFEVPGSHDSMVLEPNVRVLVSSLKRVLKSGPG